MNAGPTSATRAARRPGSKWCAVNAIVERPDFRGRYTKRSNQVQRSFEDTGLKQRGLELVLAA